MLYGVPVNFTAVLAAAIAAFVLGMLWHGPLFGKMWMRLEGFTAKSMKAMPLSMVVGFAALIVMATMLAVLMNVISVSDMRSALKLASAVWLGFIATVMLGGVLWEGRKLQLYLFNAFYQLASILLMAAVIVSM